MYVSTSALRKSRPWALYPKSKDGVTCENGLSCKAWAQGCKLSWVVGVCEVLLRWKEQQKEAQLLLQRYLLVLVRGTGGTRMVFGILAAKESGRTAGRILGEGRLSRP